MGKFIQNKANFMKLDKKMGWIFLGMSGSESGYSIEQIDNVYTLS